MSGPLFFEMHTEAGASVRFMLSAELLQRLIADPAMMPQVTRVSELERLVSPITLYPDASPKPFGFPAGLLVNAEPGWVFPLAAPDMGCGYLVLDTGIELPDRFSGAEVENSMYDVMDAVALKSGTRRSIKTDMNRLLHEGLGALGPSSYFDSEHIAAEETNSWEASTGLLASEFVHDALARALGSAAGHFVACYTVADRYDNLSPESGRVIAVVHVGAAPIRDHLNRTGVFLRLAESAIEDGLCSAADASNGLFPVDLSSADGQQMLGVAMASRNFGYANRQLVAEQVSSVLRRNLQSFVVADAAQLRHVDHVAFEASGESVRSRRGLQPLGSDSLTFVTGGEYAHGYLCRTGGSGLSAGGLCCHGSPIRESPALPLDLWKRDTPHLSPTRALDWAQSISANTEIDTSKFWSDYANLEQVIQYLDESDLAPASSLLRPLINFKEEGL